MSLIVWLPLNGDLENFGLDSAKPSGNIVYDTNGKIGKCGRMDSQLSLVPTSQIYTDNMSVSFWMKSTASSPSWHIIVALDNISLSQIHGIYIAEAGRIKYEYNPSINVYSTISQWHHYTYVLSNGKSYGYVDGELKTTSTEAMTHDLIGRIRIGAATNSMFLNDFRIYDHTLSAKEVKEISKALVLNYPLRDNIQQMDNCYGSILTNRQFWGSTGHQGSWSLVNKNQFFSTKTQSCKISNGSTATANYLVYREVQFSGGYRSFQAIIKEENGQPITNAICYPNWNGYTSGQGTANNKWTSIQDLGNGYYLCKCEGIYQTTTPSGANSHLVGIYVTKGNTIYISEWWVENNKQVCSYFLDTITPKVIDCGIANVYDGTINGKIAVVKDSPRYSYSYQFNGTLTGNTNQDDVADLIINDNFLIPTDQITLAYWYKKSARGYQGGSVFSIDRGANKDYDLYGISTYDGKYRLNTSGGGVEIAPNDSDVLNEWRHHVLTYDGAKFKLYINGVLFKEKVCSGTIRRNQNGLIIGKNTAGGGYRYFNGLMSDFRIYATALSAEDIAELYHSAVIVDNTGKSYAYEYFEAQ